MTQEQKELLLKDLCARLPYGVKGNFQNSDDKLLRSITIMHRYLEPNGMVMTGDIKPYLFPISSMTEEQKEELIAITNGKFRYMCGDINNGIPRKNTGEWGISENAYINGIKVINILYIWLLKNHFDINGLIPMGLANDATGLNIY